MDRLVLPDRGPLLRQAERLLLGRGQVVAAERDDGRMSSIDGRHVRFVFRHPSATSSVPDCSFPSRTHDTGIVPFAGALCSAYEASRERRDRVAVELREPVAGLQPGRLRRRTRRDRLHAVAGVDVQRDADVLRQRVDPDARRGPMCPRPSGRRGGTR